MIVPDGAWTLTVIMNDSSLKLFEGKSGTKGGYSMTNLRSIAFLLFDNWRPLQPVAIALFLTAISQLTLGRIVEPRRVAAQEVSGLPDIVYILSDDQAYGDYSFMGHEHIRTPHIDRLARESRLFTRGYVPDSLCRPSLASIITGLYPHQHGIVGNDPPASGDQVNRQRSYRVPGYQAQLERFFQLHIDRLETLPDRLGKIGYTSFQTGKWWEGNFARGGFQAGMTHGDHNRGARHGDVGLSIGRKGMTEIEGFVKQARLAGKPYFLWYAPMLPHTPHDPPERLLSKYAGLAPTESIAKYWAMCEYFDESIGQLRDIIAANGRPNNTIIVYVTDNGWINLPDRSAYAPRSKRSPNEGGIRTPIMFHWPGRLEPKRDDQSLISSVDLVPTTLALLKQPIPTELPGLDVLNASSLEKRKAVMGAIFEHDIVDMENAAASLQYRWIIDGHDKLILPAKRMLERTPANANAPGIELYDLRSDPQENRNLANDPDKKDRLSRLGLQLDQWWKVE